MKLMNKDINTQRLWDTTLGEILSEENIAHESELPSRDLRKGVLIEFTSMADQLAVEQFLQTLRSR